MIYKYASDENCRILLSLLKAYGVKKIIASPGTMNLGFVGSVQNDPFFEVYSAVDERSAAYMACGMSAESGQYVCLSCTGATASRNYIPGLTEAYYRKLPVIAITSTQPICKVGHNIEQVIDRSQQLKDIVRYSALIQTVKSEDDRWDCTIKINKALTEAKRHGGGPVHLNLETNSVNGFSSSSLPEIKKIEFYSNNDDPSHYPVVHGKRVAVFIGNHKKMSDALQEEITSFCEKYDAVAICDRTSNYFGKYRILPSVVIKQDNYSSELNDFDLIIHIGEVSGSQYRIKTRSVWRISEDGEMRDTFQQLDCVFEMKEYDFFRHYSQGKRTGKELLLSNWKREISIFNQKLPELPFSNLWIASTLSSCIPEGSVLYLGILNSLRSWNYFDSEREIVCYSNTGGFGIDGGVSSFVGGAISNPDVLHFCVTGDLAFFYDINVLGNRHRPSNLRLLIINNGRGVEFRKYNHPASQFGEQADLYMAAAGHNGAMSKDLVKHYAQDLGYDYLFSDSKETFDGNIRQFVDKNNPKSIVFEIFIDWRDDDRALCLINNLANNQSHSIKEIGKSILGKKGVNTVKKIYGIVSSK